PLLYSCFHQPAPPALSTLSLHDALPISQVLGLSTGAGVALLKTDVDSDLKYRPPFLSNPARLQYAFHILQDLIQNSPYLRAKPRSEEHTSELQSRFDLVCRLLLEKKYNE